MNTPEEPKKLGKKTFKNDGKIYVYDYNSLTIEQAELAKEAGEFKYNQLQNPPESFRAVIKSKGTDWFWTVLGYLLRQEIEKVTQPFNRDKAESDTEAFVRTLPISEYSLLEGCITDFFTNIGRASMLSVLLQNEVKQDGMKTLLPIMLQLIASGNLNSVSG